MPAAKSKEKYFFYLLLILVALFCTALFRPFLVILVISASLAIVLHPIFEWMNTHITRQRGWLASLLTVLTFLVVLGLPLSLIVSSVFSESQQLYLSLRQGGANHFLDSLSSFIHAKLPEAQSLDLTSKLNDLIGFVSSSILTIFTSTLNTALSLFLVLFSLFYFLKDGKHCKQYLTDLLPLSYKHDKQILERLGKAVNGIMKGYVFIALIQGALTGLGLWVFGVPNPALWGVLAGITSMIPSIGTAIVSLPSIMYLIATGHTLAAIGLSVWATILVGSIDNVLNPIIVGKQIELHPLTILFAVLGGIVLMGAAGIIIGPLAVSLLYTLLDIYKEDFQA